MKSSIILAATGAALALANNALDKRVMETDIVTEYYTVTVTGNAPAPTPVKVAVTHPHSKPTQAKPTHAADPAPTDVMSTESAPTNVKTNEAPSNEMKTMSAPSDDEDEDDDQPEPTPSQAPPQPSTTSQPIVIVTVTPEPEPQPSSSQEPAPESTSAAEKQPAPAQSTAAAGPAPGSFQYETLFHHNIHRANHSSPEMTWNDKIAGYAANTAKTCVFAHDMTEGDGNYGQNIALYGVSSGAQALGEVGAIKMATTNMWYDGEFNNFLPSYYGEATPDMSNFEGWGHLSQLVWAGSTSVGCAVQFCPAGTAYSTLDAWYSVCNYYPPGNIGGAYAKNINKPKGDAPVTV